MHKPPSIAEAQTVIAQQWPHADGTTAHPPQVLHTLIFYSQEESLEAFAVVDTGGRERFTLGTWDTETISREAELARRTKNRAVGSQSSVGGILRILVSLDGSPLPITRHGRMPQDFADWVDAFSFQSERVVRWEQTLQR